MKNRNLPAYIIIGSIILLITGVILYLRQYLPKHSWGENLITTNEEPYGLNVLYNLIKDSYPKDAIKQIKHNNFSLIFKENPNADYIYIGTNYYIDSINVLHLLNHVSKGRNAFIAVNNPMESFLHYCLSKTEDRTDLKYIQSDTIKTSLHNSSGPDSSYVFYYQFLKRTENYMWHYFNTSFLSNFGSYRVLSTIDDNKPNFIAVPYGQGWLFLHSTPIFFSNYHLLREQSFKYLKEVWKVVESDTIIWDNFSASYANKASFAYLKESPLRFILKHRSFRWAWYMLVIIILLFLIVQSKRKQNIIPIIKPKKNNTLEYATAIGTLYFQSKNHAIITEEMTNQLYSFIRSRYNIRIDKERQNITSHLSKVSGISEARIEELFKLEIKLKYGYPESEHLFKLYHIVDYIYKNCN